MSIIMKLLGGREFNVKDYATQAKDGRWVIVPGEFYPAMVAHIRASIESDDLPAELVDKRVRPRIDPTLAARRYWDWARQIPEWAWGDALVPLATMQAKADDDRLDRRAEVLELARKWFTRALKNDQGVPIRIQILKDERFRLGTNKQFGVF